MSKEIIIQELASLIRTLEFIQEEQAFIKFKLIDLIQRIQQGNDVVWAEEMHQQILNRELAIQLVQKDVIALDRKLKITSTITYDESGTLCLFKKYKQQVTYLEQEFSNWKRVVDQHLEIPSVN